jgi:hypothetical protein
MQFGSVAFILDDTLFFRNCFPSIIGYEESLHYLLLSGSVFNDYGRSLFIVYLHMQFKRMAPIFLQVYDRFASVKFRGSLNGSIFKVNVEFHSIKFKNSLISLKGVVCPFLLDIFTSKFAQVEYSNEYECLPLKYLEIN